MLFFTIRLRTDHEAPANSENVADIF
jgi:hypothetical protein